MLLLVITKASICLQMTHRKLYLDVCQNMLYMFECVQTDIYSNMDFNSEWCKAYSEKENYTKQINFQVPKPNLI